MARSEWLRTFVAVYRAGSVTDGAAARAITQPAASQQLRGLERAVGTPLFTRSTAGVAPTRAGRELYARVADPLDHLEAVLVDLDAGTAPLPARRLHVGASAELFDAVLVPRLAPLDVAVDARFGDDRALLDALTQAEIEIAVTSTPAPKRVGTSTVIAHRRYVLVAAPELAPARRPSSPARLGAWAAGRPWVSYSDELPVTRRFWQRAFGRPFDASLRLVAADLRVVAAAVEAGTGASLLPDFVCRPALDAGRIVEVYPVGDLVAEEPIFASVAAAAASRPDVERVLHALTAE